MTQVDASTNSSVPLSHGLTALHLAVLANDYRKVRKIIGDGEVGIDVPTATGTTALMLAALYGRSNIFFFLAGYNASSTMKDSYHYSARHYVDPQSPFLKDLIREYNTIASSEPDRVGRRHIFRELKARRHERREAYDLGLARGRAEAQAQAKSRDQAQIQLQTSVNVDHFNAQPPPKDPSLHLAFLRSLDGKQQVVMEGRQVATAEHGTIGRKCTGFIYAGDENDSHKFAVSGWGRAIQDKNAVFRNVLDNKDYTELVKRVATLIGFELKGNHFDHHFLGSPSEKKGTFVACHSEKQLAVFVLTKALSHVFGTKSLTANNINLLKDQLNKLPPGLRETVIHLDHKLVCGSCVQFLQLLTQKTGLVFRCKSHDWYTYGKRPQLRHLPDGSYRQIPESTSYSGPNENMDIIEDEIGIFDTDGIMEAAVQSDSAGQEGDGFMVPSDSVTPSTPSNRRPGLARQLVLRAPTDFEKRGSPVFEEPKYDATRYSVPDVTPPSKNAQELPTPQSQSHTRLTEVPRITISPSPLGVSSTFGPQTDSMSPSMSQEYEVEEILQSKEENGVHLYLVKWKGYQHDSNTWEPETNLTNASDTIGKFWEELNAIQPPSQDLDGQGL
ncbi:hypothetical protein INS49_007390 [Diaporthe citri]|uniref:uncharacterized protein n=1 Tax=Diaporthe citri TaxID=83186 RepID=UPI001C818E2B|nr:uncharacterized protein INS49_007390 [Diaporthe citri]KAG6365779.1 hypothetical protein INS49_007390 [Diaporthe citri]